MYHDNGISNSCKKFTSVNKPLTVENRTALEEIGFSFHQTRNVLHTLIKINFLIFIVDLEPSDVNKGIFHINSLLQTKIKIKVPYKIQDLFQRLNW